MSAATTLETLQLFNTYNINLLANPNVACYINALKALLVIAIESNLKVVPSIWGMDFPENPEDDRHHAYLAVNGKVYNGGVTWPDNHYKDVAYEELQEQGTDRTTNVTVHALADIDKYNQLVEELKNVTNLEKFTDLEEFINLAKLIYPEKLKELEGFYILLFLLPYACEEIVVNLTIINYMVEGKSKEELLEFIQEMLNRLTLHLTDDL